MNSTPLSTSFTSSFDEQTGEPLKLFSFYCAGANISMFNSWRKNSPEGLDVIPVELPGRGSKMSQPLLDNIYKIVNTIAPKLEQQLTGPFAFLGHSMGALVAYELARYLRRHDEDLPLHLFVASHSAPHLFRRTKPLYKLPEKEFITELKKMNGTPDEVLDNKDLMGFLIPILRSDFKACETYKWKVDLPLPCGITAFGGVDDESVTANDLKMWEQHTTGSFELRPFPGDHFFLYEQQDEILNHVSKTLVRNAYIY